jgi:hypothetical protein
MSLRMERRVLGVGGAWAFAVSCLVALALWAALPNDDSHAQQPETGPAVSGSAPPSAEPAPSAPAPADSAAPSAPPEVPPAAPPPPDRMKVFILTFSPGDHPFYKFGHNAIWIHDEGQKNPMLRDKVYNYGMFSFGDPKLIPKFFLGRFMYWLDADLYASTVRGYKRENRAIESQELDLSPAQEIELQRALEENLKPENKYYKYDYYRDNCSTRVRDMIDKVTGGRVRAAATGPQRLTYRQHTLRLTASLPAEYVILNFVMGNLIDQPGTKWEEAFIPMELQETMRHVTLVDENGVERPIVKDEKLLLPSQQTPPPKDPPTWWPYSLLAGLGIGGLLAGIGRAAVKNTRLRVLFGVMLSFFGLLWGFFGLFFLAAWAFTDHAVGYHNENTLLSVPWAIVLVGTGVNVARSRVKSMERAHILIKAALAASLLGLVLKVLPWFDQANGFFLVFFIPFWAGAFFGIHQLVVNVARVAIAATGGKPSPKKAGVKKAATPPQPADRAED